MPTNDSVKKQPSFLQIIEPPGNWRIWLGISVAVALFGFTVGCQAAAQSTYVSNIEHSEKITDRKLIENLERHINEEAYAVLRIQNMLMQRMRARL